MEELIVFSVVLNFLLAFFSVRRYCEAEDLRAERNIWRSDAVRWSRLAGERRNKLANLELVIKESEAGHE